MKKDYHLHPAAIQHPERFHSFVQAAIRRGMGEICITDHMPLSCSTQKDRIPAGMVGAYCRFIKEESKQYEGRIRILRGIEIDYHPAFQKEIDSVLSEGEFDLILGSSHLHVGPGKPFERYRCRREYAEASLENTRSMIRTGRYDILPHLDMYRWIFARPDVFFLEDDGYTTEYILPLAEQVLSEAGAAGIRLELNSHLAYKFDDLSRNYPVEPILRKALEMNLPLSYGTDAHSADWVGWGWEEMRDHPLYGEALSRIDAE